MDAHRRSGPMPRLLDLRYSPRLPPAKLAAMEREGRRLGLPLATLERLGQDEALLDAFLAAAARPPAASRAAVQRLLVP